MSPESSGAVVEETTTDDQTRHGWRTILLNCDCHSFDQVEGQLIKAIRCSLSQARKYSWEVHSKGSAVVYKGHRERCEAVAMVLDSIGLLTKVAQ